MTGLDIMLDGNDADFVDQLIAALGLKPGEPVNIVTPQFHRTDGRTISYYPRTIEEYAALPQYREETLRKMGCQKWERKGDTVLWLFPKEWYPYIPEGLVVTDINWKRKSFAPKQTDSDCRFGALAYGFEAAAE